MNTDKFQGMCLVNSEGWRHMDIYDDMPARVRHRLAYSPFNLCPYCVYMHAETEQAIAAFEDFIREGRL